MSEIADLIDAVVREGLAPHLRSRRFEKHARTFTFEAAACTQIVNVQASQWNEGRDGRFTLNLGVYFPKVAERRGRVAKGAYPKESESTLRIRIGRLMPDNLDQWWEIHDGTDTRRLSDEVVNAYATCGEPWLNEVMVLENVLPRLRKGDLLMAAATALELGKRDVAREIVSEALSRANPEFAPTVRRFAEKQGIGTLENQ